MSQDSQSMESFIKKNGLVLSSVGILVAFLALVGFMYFFVRGKTKGGIIFPAGLNYTGAEATPTPGKSRPTYNWSEMSASADWATFKSQKGQYQFQHPKALYPLIFPGDPNDSMTFDIADIPVQFNLMALVERISAYDAKLVGKPEEFVRNYWRHFPGLGLAKNFEAYETEKGLKGYKVNFVTKGGVTLNDNYFFIMPGDDDRIMHVHNIFPKEGESIFLRILNSLDYVKK